MLTGSSEVQDLPDAEHVLPVLGSLRLLGARQLLVERQKPRCVWEVAKVRLNSRWTLARQR